MVKYTIYFLQVNNYIIDLLIVIMYFFILYTFSHYSQATFAICEFEISATALQFSTNNFCPTFVFTLVIGVLKCISPNHEQLKTSKNCEKQLIISLERLNISSSVRRLKRMLQYDLLNQIYIFKTSGEHFY